MISLPNQVSPYEKKRIRSNALFFSTLLIWRHEQHTRRRIALAMKSGSTVPVSASNEVFGGRFALAMNSSPPILVFTMKREYSPLCILSPRRACIAPICRGFRGYFFRNKDSAYTIRADAAPVWSPKRCRIRSHLMKKSAFGRMHYFSVLCLLVPFKA